MRDACCVCCLLVPAFSFAARADEAAPEKATIELDVRDTQPDLLAPRNVLSRHAARESCDEPPHAEDARELQLLTDDSLVEASTDVGTGKLLVTPECDLLSGEPAPGAKPEVEKLFLIEPSGKWQRRNERPPYRPLKSYIAN